MPELYEKELARPGLWAADGGSTLVTPARIDHWEREFNRLRSEGFSFPTPYGHKLNAVPTADDPYALDEAYARWNAGYIERLQKKNGKLFMLATVPPGYRVDETTGNLINERDGTVIREVSPGFGDWVDGYGREHKDIIFHAALCTHPVQPNQSGFVPAGATDKSARSGQVRFLSAAGRISRLTMLATPKGKTMADDKDKDKKDDDKGKKDSPPFEKKADTAPSPEPAADAPPADLPALDPGAAPADAPGDLPPADSMPDPITEPPIEEPPMPGGPDDPAGLNAGGGSVTPEQASQFTQIMEKLGAPLLPGTNQTNIVERLLILLHNAANQGASLMPSGGQAASTQPIDVSTEGATPDPNGMGVGMGMGGGPIFMSTRTKQIVKLDPSGRALAEQAATKEMESISAEWDKIAGTRGMSASMKAICLREKAAASRYHMSLNPDTGAVLNERARQKLYLVKEVLKASGIFKFLGAMSKGVPLDTPALNAPRAKPTSAPANHDDLRNEIAARMGVKPEAVRIVTGMPDA